MGISGIRPEDFAFNSNSLGDKKGFLQQILIFQIKKVSLPGDKTN
jgi:hypothetical protein